MPNDRSRRLIGRPRILSLAIASGLLLLVGACGGNTYSAAAPARMVVHRSGAGVLNWWSNYGATWADSLDPPVAGSANALIAVQLVHANLVKFDYPGLKVIPDLARWKTSHGGRVYTFTIRSHARFSNGDRVTAEDVAWSLTRALLPSTQSAVALTHLGLIKGAAELAAGKTKSLRGVRVLGRNRLRITLVKRAAYFLAALAHPSADVLDSRAMLGKEPGRYLTDNCRANIGAGPFEFVCGPASTGHKSFYASGAPSMDFRPNPYYYGHKPRIKLHAPFFRTVQAAYRAYTAGQLDGAVVPTEDSHAARQLSAFMQAPQPETDYLTPNSQLPPFDNLHCRLAVAYAIDRERVTRQVMHGAEGAQYDMVPPGILSYFGRSTRIPTFDPARAKSELERCPGRLKQVTMTVQKSAPDIVREYRAVQHDLARIGAQVAIKELDINAWIKVVTENMNLTRDQERITENLWVDDYPDPQDWCTNLMRSNSPDNIGGFKSALYDALVDRADASSSPRTRSRLYREAQSIALQGGYWIAVGYVNGLYLVHPRVRGLVVANGWTWPQHDDWSRVSTQG